MSPALSFVARYLPGELAALEVVRRDDRALLLPGRDVVVHQDDLDARLDRLVERGRHGRARRRDGDALDALGDHVLDRGDLAGVVGAALAAGVDDARARRRLVPLLRRVDEREVEVDRELRDEPELDGVAAVVRASHSRSRSSRARDAASTATMTAPLNSRFFDIVRPFSGTQT